jgi:hypothetical protein
MSCSFHLTVTNGESLHVKLHVKSLNHAKNEILCFSQQIV